MSVDFTKMSFGKTETSSSSSKKDDKPKAQFWLNIGYQVEVPTDSGNEDRFVSLPQGIPLDTQEAVSTKSKNKDWQAFQVARNDLLSQMLKLAETLEPGEEKLLNLQIQLRRVSDEEEVTEVQGNPYARTLTL